MFVAVEVQKLLTTCRLPSTCPAGFTYSHFQCWVWWICLAALLWQVRQALVTSGPDWKSCCSTLICACSDGGLADWEAGSAAWTTPTVTRAARKRAARNRSDMRDPFRD